MRNRGTGININIVRACHPNDPRGEAVDSIRRYGPGNISLPLISAQDFALFLFSGLGIHHCYGPLSYARNTVYFCSYCIQTLRCRGRDRCLSSLAVDLLLVVWMMTVGDVTIVAVKTDSSVRCVCQNGATAADLVFSISTDIFPVSCRHHAPNVVNADLRVPANDTSPIYRSSSCPCTVSRSQISCAPRDLNATARRAGSTDRDPHWWLL